ncbi:MAG: hypothetical protein IJ640_09240 [Prevotella sp.]|nr:hypothetical protein [Prevotella sp.]
MDIQKLFGLLKTKYPQSGLSDNEIKGIAATLIATGLVTDENAAAIVDAQADAMRGFQSLFDSRYTTKKDDLTRTLTASLEKAFKEKYHINDEGKQVEQQTEKPDDISALIKAQLDAALKPITDRFAQEDGRREAEVRMAAVIEAAKKNGIPEELARELNVPADVDLDSYMKDKSQAFANLGFQKVVPPGTGNEPPTDGKAFADQIRAGAPRKEGN